MNLKLIRLKRIESAVEKSKTIGDKSTKRFDVSKLSPEEVNRLLAKKMEEARKNGTAPNLDNLSPREIQELLEEKLYKLRMKNRGKLAR
jgi:hypothetical protein